MRTFFGRHESGRQMAALRKIATAVWVVSVATDQQQPVMSSRRREETDPQRSSQYLRLQPLKIETADTRKLAV